MASNAWYSGSNANKFPQYPNGQVGEAAADSVQDAHRLLAVYPFASATPSTHAARHLSGLAVPAMGPSYMQSQNTKSPNYPHPPTHPASYSQYAAEINHLQSQQVSSSNSGYWADTRNDTLRYLGNQSSHSYINYQPHGRTWTYPSQPTHASNAFATSIFQHTMPSLSYPTPPPGIRSSSSSLANALVERPSQPRSNNYDSRESATFFNNFLDKSSRELEKAQTAKYSYSPVKQESEWKESLPTSSPDPLALEPPAPLTPQKRKPVEQIQSPVIKRVQGPQRTTALPAHSAPSSSPPSSLSMNTSISKIPVSTVKKRKMQAYIELPVLSRQSTTPTSSKHATFKTPSKKAKIRLDDDDDDDLGGYGSEDEDVQPRKTSFTIIDMAKTSAKRTGDRDDRGPIEKLITLLEDIFEAEDGLAADVELDSLPTEFFSRLSCDASRPHLHPNMIRKLTKHVAQAARPMKRLRGHSGLPSTPAKTKVRPESIADIEASTVSRILKVLERTVRAGEDLDPFSNKLHLGSTGTRSVPSSPVKKRNTKGAKRQDVPSSRRSKSQTPRDDENERRPEAVPPSSEGVRDLNLEEFTRQLDVARNSILAADCCMAILGSDRLSKQVYSEELITTCLAAVKNQLDRIIYRFIEFSPAMPQADPFLLFLAKGGHQSQNHRRQLGEMFQSLSSVLPRINDLISTDAVTMSDAVVIQAVYIAIGPFFVLDSGEEERGKGRKDNLVLNTFGQSAMRGLRLNALSLIRSIFAHHEEQRSWIIEEILTSLIKLSETKQKAGQFRLRDGRSIRTVSALLLQLVQTSAHGIRDEARRLSKARQQLLGAQCQEGPSNATSQAFLNEKDTEEIQLYLSGLESATKAAKTIIVFLTQRSGKGKATKNSNEAEYRNILDNLISDVLAVLFWPEWPAASLLLSIICKFMVASLDDIKHTTHNAKDNDNNAARNIALDHLGIIAARLRASMLKFQGNGESALRPLDEILPSANLKQLSRLVQAHHDISVHLSKRSSEDQAYDSARDLTAVTWGQELAVALKQCDVVLDDAQRGFNSVSADQPRLLLFGSKLKNALRDVWKEAGVDVFDLGSESEVTRTDRLAEEIGTVQDLRNLFQPILTVILHALDAPPVFMRTKALRALGQIVTSDASILSAPNVRRGIESHLLDSSPAVRDAAVELIGKYIIDSPEVAGDYYQKIADRIADTGLGVRKRVIKLLRSVYGISDDFERRVDICSRLVLRMYDEDEGVRDLAVKAIEELWFTSSPIGTSIPRQQEAIVATVPGDKAQLLAKVAVIMSVSGSFRERQSPLEDVLHKLMAGKEEAEASSLHERYSEICEVLIDGLVDASDLPGFTVINCVRTIYLFTSAYPAILTSAHASTLLPYLKNASTPDEQTTSDYLLKTFRVSIPQMPKTAAKFGVELQTALQPMILKPSAAGGTLALQETVACMCAVVTHLTHDFKLLTGLLKSCNRSLRKSMHRKERDTLPMQDIRALTMLIFIVALLVENCNFDRLRGEKPELVADLDDVTKGSITEHVYTSLLALYQGYTEPVLRDRILQCLGFLFRAQPTLMTMESSAMIMDAIFASAQEESRARLLKVMQEFLVSEASKHSAKTQQGNPGATDLDMEELVGNTDGFADSGVSSAIVQRYLDPILQAVLSQHSQTQSAAIDILSFTIKQGLAHPLQSFPVVIALETSPSPTLSSRANALHAILHTKHSSLLNSRYVISARASFEYQKKLGTGPVQGYNVSKNNPTALLQQWYTLVREKRPSRLDFLRSLLRVFELKGDHACTQDDVEFTRYMAENFATLDYKTQEEVLVVAKSLTTVLSTVGMHLIESLSPSHLLVQLHAPLHPQQTPNGDQEMHGVEVPQQSQVQSPDIWANEQPASDVAQSPEKMPLLRSSIIVAIVMLLRAYLKTTYGITEDKCLKWVIGKKNAQGDRAAIRRHLNPLTWERLPFAVRPLLTTEDMAAQRDTFLQVWTDDGVSGEPEEDFEEHN